MENNILVAIACTGWTYKHRSSWRHHITSVLGSISRGRWCDWNFWWGLTQFRLLTLHERSVLVQCVIKDLGFHLQVSSCVQFFHSLSVLVILNFVPMFSTACVVIAVYCLSFPRLLHFLVWVLVMKWLLTQLWVSACLNFQNVAPLRCPIPPPANLVHV